MHTLLSALILATSLFTSTASAAECQWDDEDRQSVFVAGKNVYVGAHAYSVAGSVGQAEFENELRRCGADNAVPAYREWVGRRRWVKRGTTGIIVGALVPVGWFTVLPAAIIVTAVHGPRAADAREATVRAIRATAGE